MSSTIDPAKLKVVDLRTELSTRGLDTKGNKATLVKRLKDALEKELKHDLPDTSIADTSSEDLDTSQTEGTPKKANERNISVDEEMESDEQTETSADKTLEKAKSSEKRTTTGDSPEKPSKTPAKGSPEKAKTTAESSRENVGPASVEEKNKENGEHSEQQDETKARKSRWAEEEEKPTEEGDSEQSTENKPEDGQGDSKGDSKDKTEKGEKRKRGSESPERSQRRRSRSPVKEDEPDIDGEKVQLSWYDSDLHLQVDKESFLSAKPLTDGAFGYAWAGVRATHGVSSGKVFYEVKLTEELKWEDFAKHLEQQKGGRDRYRTDHRKNQRRDKDKKNSEKKSGDKPTSENGENKEEKPTEKDEKSSDKDEKSLEDKEKSSEEKETSLEGESDEKVEKMEDKPAETEDKSEENDENPKEDAEKAEETPMETDAASESDKKVEDAGDESKSKEDKAEEVKPAEVKPEPIPSHFFRVGWSVIGSSLQLGEEKHSYGYESSGKFVTDKQFIDYGIKFGVGDVIAAFLSIDDEDVTITYSVNGELQPVATTVPRSELPEENFALFPHVLSRNYAFEFNLGDKEEPWFPIPGEFEDDYVYLSKAEEKVAGPARPENRGECEVLIMCGLPASGKTHWVREHSGANQDKRYTIIGNTYLLERMTVSGEPLKSKFKGRWSMLIDRLQKCLNKLIAIAALRRRNYIIDQTNVFPSAQRRKMRPFEGFKRRAVIVVVGDEEQARRQSLQEAQDGKDVPDSTILEMKAAMSLPETGGWIDEVIYAGLEETEAKEVVKKYNAAGKEAGYGTEKRFGRRDDRWQNRRHDYRGGKNYRDRSYQNQRYDPRGQRQGGWNNPRPGGGGGSGGGWNRDRRDNRGPPSREWRGSGRDHGGRDNRSQGGSYNRSRPSGGRGQSWGAGGYGGGQGWNQQTFGSGGYGGGGHQNWGGQGGGQWKYGGSGGGGGGSNTGTGGQGYGGGGGYGNWNYYGQYAQQNWNSQK